MKKENVKLLSWGLIILSFIFIWKLFWFSGQVTSGGGSWIGGIGGGIRYFWFENSHIAIVLFLLLCICIFILQKETRRDFYIILVLFFLSISGKLIFMLFNEDFRFFLTPTYLQYTDRKGKVTDMNKYLTSINKYCRSGDGWKFHLDSREGYCYLSGKYIIDFDTVEEYIQALEFFKENDWRFLYRETFLGAEKIGYENLIKVYEDKTFYAFFIYRTSDIKILKLISEFSNDKEIKNVVSYYITKINNYNLKKEKISINEDYKYWDDLSDEIYRVINLLNGVNINIL